MELFPVPFGPTITFKAGPNLQDALVYVMKFNISMDKMAPFLKLFEDPFCLYFAQGVIWCKLYFASQNAKNSYKFSRSSTLSKLRFFLWDDEAITFIKRAQLKKKGVGVFGVKLPPIIVCSPLLSSFPFFRRGAIKNVKRIKFLFNPSQTWYAF